MSAVQNFRNGVADDSLRVAILVGLAVVPFTLITSWGPVSDEGVVLGGSISGAPLLLAGLIVGYYYSDRETESRRAGVWTGLAASVGTVLIYLANSVTSISSASGRMSVVAAVVTPIVVVIGVGLTVTVTAAIAMGADWVRKRLDRDRRVIDQREVVDQDVRDSRWWIPIAAYVLVAPPAMITVVISEGQSDSWLLLSILFLLVLVPLSIVAFVALFIDATAPRAAETAWIPNMWVYVGVPIAGYVLVYLVAAFYQIPKPSAPGVYGFIAALWVTAIAYLVARHRHVGGRIR